MIVTGNAWGFVKVILGVAAFWQTVVVPLMVAVGVGRTVTVVDAAVEVPHPEAVTLTVAVPEKPAAHDTVPVVPVPEIVLPVPVTVHA